MQPHTFIKAPEKLHKEKQSFKIQSRKVQSPGPVLQVLSTLLSLVLPQVGPRPLHKISGWGLHLSRLPAARPPSLVHGLSMEPGKGPRLKPGIPYALRDPW